MEPEDRDRDKDLRHASVRRSKIIARRCLKRTNVTYKDIQEATFNRYNHNCDKLFNAQDPTHGLTYAQLLELATNERTREFARQLIAPVIAAADGQSLRATDLLLMAQDNETMRETARTILRDVVRMLWPDKMK